jgi:lysozyme family protein
MSNFDRAVDVVLFEEGGYVDDPDDPGGETIYGITRRDHPALWANGRPSIDQAKSVYREQYWNQVKGDDLPWPLCLFVFDSAVNQGVSAAIRMMQRALDTAQDGILGPATLRLAKASREWHAARFMAYRAMRYFGTRNFDKFGEDWLIRLARVAMRAK